MKKLHSIYVSIKTRCYNPKCKSYKYYGGRGIAICKEWLTPRSKEGYKNFKEWALSHGYKDGLSIDRIDNSKGYSSSNCRWVTLKEQQNNRTNNHYITYNGKTQTLAQWCEELGLCYNKIKIRLNRRHWSVEKAFQTEGNASEKIISYKGEKKSMSEWCRILSIDYRKTRARISRGWSVEKAFETE